MHKAKEIIPADDDGVSDPYLVINLNGVQVVTETLFKTINPVWNTTILMRVPFTNIDDSPPINIKMYDYDQYSNDEFIGVCYIDLKNAQYERNLFYNLNKIPTPTWYNLSYRNGVPGGKILLGFNLFVNETIPASLPSLLPPYEKYNIKIKALGVRGLQQIGVYSIKKPLVVFNVDSMRDPNCKINLPEKNLLIAEAKNYGPDANFSTIVK